MKRIIPALVVAAVACHASPPMTSAANELPRLTVTSDGGLTGRGLGGIDVEGGRVTATSGKSCTGALTDGERRELGKVIAIDDTEATGHGSPDQIHYTLRAGDRTSSWYGEEPPKEIAPLFRLLWRIRERVLAGC